MGISLPTRYVALLRAINVGGRNVKMDRLREIFVGLGFENVETYIASGNVLFTAVAGSVGELESAIELALGEQLGFGVPTFVADGPRIITAARRAPFDGRWATDGMAHHIGALKRPPTEAERARVAALQTAADEFEFHDLELYWLCHTRSSDSKITPIKLEKALGQPTTLRNRNTLSALAERLAG